MRNDPNDTFDSKRLESLPPLSLSEAAWMAGVTTEAFERFLEAVNMSTLRALPITELLRAGFTLLGQREAQVAMFRLQLAAALQREKELTEALHSKLTAGMANFVVPPAPPSPVSSAPATPAPPGRKPQKRGKKK